MKTSSNELHVKRNYGNARRTVILAAVIAILLVAIGYPYLGVIAIAICGLFRISFIPWRLTTYGRPADPRPIVVSYLIAVIFFKIHVGEEYLTEIWNAFSGIGQPMTEQTFFLVAATIAPIFWLTGLILLYLRTEIGNWMTWVFVIAMALIEASKPSHSAKKCMSTHRRVKCLNYWLRFCRVPKLIIKTGNDIFRKREQYTSQTQRFVKYIVPQKRTIVFIGLRCTGNSKYVCRDINYAFAAASCSLNFSVARKCFR